MGSVIGCGLPRDLITIEYKVAALFFFKLLLAFGGMHVLRGRGIGGGGACLGGPAGWASAFAGGNSCWGVVALSAGPLMGRLAGCVQSRARLAIRGLSCWKASVTLYLWFSFVT